MPLLNWKSGLIVSGLLTALVAGCAGDKGKSSQVTIGVSPSQPIVISANSLTKKAPWFDFTVVIANNSNATLKIVGLQVSVELNDNGLKLTGEGAYSPDDYATIYSTESSLCSYEDLGTIPAGQTKELTLVNKGSGTACPTNAPITFTLTNGPKIEGSSNYRYRGTVSPQGWFVNADGSLERFDKSGSFSTQ